MTFGSGVSDKVWIVDRSNQVMADSIRSFYWQNTNNILYTLFPSLYFTVFRHTLMFPNRRSCDTDSIAVAVTWEYSCVWQIKMRIWSSPWSNIKKKHFFIHIFILIKKSEAVTSVQRHYLKLTTDTVVISDKLVWYLSTTCTGGCISKLYSIH